MIAIIIVVALALEVQLCFITRMMVVNIKHLNGKIDALEKLDLTSLVKEEIKKESNSPINTVEHLRKILDIVGKSSQIGEGLADDICGKP